IVQAVSRAFELDLGMQQFFEHVVVLLPERFQITLGDCSRVCCRITFCRKRPDVTHFKLLSALTLMKSIHPGALLQRLATCPSFAAPLSRSNKPVSNRH